MRDIIKLLESLNVEVDEAYGGEDAAESYLAYIDELVAKLDDKKIAYEIMNATDDIRKALDMEPTNARMNIESAVSEANTDGTQTVLQAIGELIQSLQGYESGDDGIDLQIDDLNGQLAELQARLEGDYASFDESIERIVKEGLGELAHEAEKDHEVQMARSDLYKIAKYAVAIHKMLKDKSEMDGLEGWVQAKITKSADYMGAVKHYMEGEAMADVELAVVPVSGDMTDAMDIPQESVEEVHEIKEERLGYSDLSSEDQSRVDLKCRQNPKWDSMEPGEKDKYRYKVAKEMGLVESKIEEGRNDGPMSECCDAPLIGFENGLGRCSDCGEMAGAWNEDELDENQAVAEEDVIGDLVAKLEKNNRKEKFSMPAAKSQSDMMKDIVAKLGPSSDEETTNKPAVSQQQAQAQANKAVRSMGQDKTTGAPGGILRQSKFSEWSKK